MSDAWNFFCKHWKAYWFIRTIVIIFIVAICLAVLVQILKEVPSLTGSIIQCAARGVYSFFQDWAMVLSASVMFMIAAAAVWAILDNRYGRRLDRMQRLRNEIISWASEVRKALFVSWFERDTVIQAGMREKLEALVVLRSVVEGNAAELESTSELVTKVKNAANHLGVFIQNLQHTPVNEFDSLKVPWENLNKEFLNLIESTSSIVIPEFK